FTFVLLRILIFICIFSIGSIFLDVFPLKELVYLFIRSKKEVAINIGIGRIIELKKIKSNVIYYVNIIIGIVQIGSSIFIFSLISLITMDIISIDNITIGSAVIPAKFLFISFLLFFGTVLLFSGPLSIYLNRETKTLGI
ncbi:hypothetical protein LCGC14_2462640, partial [marine sediment metagenome]